MDIEERNTEELDIYERVVIDAPPERVWELTLDLARWPEWTPTVDAVEVLDPGPVRIGTRARLTQPGNRPAVWTVTVLEAERAFVWETRALGMRVTASHLLDATEGGTTVTLGIDISGPTRPLLGWLVRRASRKFLPQEAAALKLECEEQ